MPYFLEQYEHYGRKVWTRSDLKGTHRDRCLCYVPCRFFKPNQPDNCEIAQAVLAVDVKFGLTTPVFECPKFEPLES